MTDCPISHVKQYLTMSVREHFIIPPPYRAWCNDCSLGFMSIDELQAHDKKKLAVHQGRGQ